MISIITICLNDKASLIKTRKSVETQICHNYEHIIVDGASTDGTLEYLKDLDDSVIWVSEPDRGRSDAFNKGIKMASGDIILCLNAGDVLYDETVIGDIWNEWVKDPADVLSCMVEQSSGQIMWCKNEDYWNRGLHAHQGVFVTREAYARLGGYNTYLKSRMDYDLFLRMAKLNLSHRLVERIVTIFDTNGISQYEKKLSFSEKCGLELIYTNNLSEEDIEMLKRVACIKDCASKKNLVDDKAQKYTLLLNWTDKMISGKSIKDYCKENGLKKVSVYGAGQLGALLIKELKGSCIEVKELLDVVENKYIGELASGTVETISSDVDAVIVTVLDGYEEISNSIKKYKNVRVLSLKEIVASL